MEATYEQSSLEPIQEDEVYETPTNLYSIWNTNTTARRPLFGPPTQIMTEQVKMTSAQNEATVKKAEKTPSVDNIDHEIQHSVSGLNALSFLTDQQDDIPCRTVKPVALVMSTVPLNITDNHIYEMMDRKVQSTEILLERWYKDRSVKDTVEAFVKNIKETTGYQLRSVLNEFINYWITIKGTSLELAIKATLHFSTVKLQLNSKMNTTSENQRAIQIVEFWRAYLTTENDHMNAFERECGSQKGDLLDRIDNLEMEVPLEYMQPENIPGIQRLGTGDAQQRQQIWARAYKSMVKYICGNMSKDSIDVSSEKAQYFVPSDDRKPHQLRQTVNNRGEIQPMKEVLLNEHHIYTHLQKLETILQTGQLHITNYARTKNIMRAVHPDVREKFMFVFSLQDDFELIQGIPDMPWEQIKKCMIQSTNMANNDQKSRKLRIEHVKKNQTENKNTSSSKKQKHSCRVCKNDEHSTKECPNRPGQPCTHWVQHGECKFGDNCIFDHGQKDTKDTKKQETESTQSQQKEMQTLECKLKLHEECKGTFQVDKKHWETKLQENPTWQLPKSCFKCKQMRQQQRESAASSNMMTAADMEYDSDQSEIDDDVLADYALSTLMTTTHEDVQNHMNTQQPNQDFQNDLARSVNIWQTYNTNHGESQ